MKKYVLTALMALLLALACAAPAEDEAEGWVACMDGRNLVIADAREGLKRADGTILLGIGETLAISAPPEKNPMFSSGNEDVLTVDAQGVATAHKRGVASLRVYLDGLAAVTLKIEVKHAPSSVKLVVKRLTVEMGSEKILKPQFPSGSAARVTWTSSDESIASVSEDGIITPNGVGACTVTATAFNGKYAECAITVRMPDPARVKLNDYKVTLYEGETYALKVTLEGGYQEIYTCSSSDETVVSTDLFGCLTAVSEGTAIVRVEASEGGYTNCVVNVKPGASDVRLKTDAVTLYEGGRAKIEAETVGGSGKYTLTVADPAIAVVSDKNELTALRAGLTYFRAEAPSGAFAEGQLVVEPLPGELSLRAESSVVAVQETLPLTFSGGSLPVTFSSSDPKIASVDENGVVTGKKPGVVTVTARSGGLTASIEAEVARVAKEIRFDQTEVIICAGDKRQLHAAPIGGAGKPSYSSNAPEIVLADPDTGVVTALWEGTARITARLSNGARATCEVKCVGAPTSAAIETAPPVIGNGDSIPLSCRLNDGLTATLFWSSDNPRVATVDENGVARSTGENGVARVFARTYNGVEASVLVNVTDAPSEIRTSAMPLQPGGSFDEYLCLKAGESASLRLWGGECTHISADYQSSQPNVAEVQANGRVTAKSAGTTRVTVTAYNGLVLNVLVEVE